MRQRLTTLLWLHVLNDGYRTTVVTILPFVAQDLSLNLTQVGFLGSSQTVIGTLLAVPAGYLAAKIGGFALLAYALLLYALGFVGISIAPHFAILLLAFYGTAIGFAVFHPVSFALVSRLSQTHNRGKSMGRFMSIGDIGRIVIPPLVLVFVPIIGWRLVVMILGLVGLGGYGLARGMSSPKLAVSKSDWIKAVAGLLKESKFRGALLAAIGDGLASSSIYIFLGFLLLSRGIATTQLVWFMGAFLLGSLTGKNILGGAVDKWGNRKVFVVAEWCMALVLLALVNVQQFILLLMIACGLGMFTRGTGPVVQTLVAESIHETHLEKAYGISEAFIQMAAAVSVLVAGVVADRWGIEAVYYLAAILGIMATMPMLLAKGMNQLRVKYVHVQI